MTKNKDPITKQDSHAESRRKRTLASTNPAVKTPPEKALMTATWARTLTKAVISRNNKKPPYWHIINFLGDGKQESAGIIDLLAIRKDHQKGGALPPGDGFEIVLIQVKGGRAKNPTATEVQRMEAVAQRYNAKSVVLSSWKKGGAPEFRILSNSVWVGPLDPDSIFNYEARKNKNITKEKKIVSPKAKKVMAKSEKRSAAAKVAWAKRKKSTI